MDFMDLKLHLWLIRKTLKKNTHTHTHKNTKTKKNKEKKYIPLIVWMVGLIKTSTMDFTNIKLPK